LVGSGKKPLAFKKVPLYSYSAPHPRSHGKLLNKIRKVPAPEIQVAAPTTTGSSQRSDSLLDKCVAPPPTQENFFSVNGSGSIPSTVKVQFSLTATNMDNSTVLAIQEPAWMTTCQANLVHWTVR